MIQVEEIKAKLAYEVLNRYIAQFPSCQTVKDLEPITRLLLKQVVELALPKFRVELLLIDSEMPQDNIEENKEQMAAEKKIARILQKIQTKAQAKQENFSKKIQGLTEEHNLMAQQLERLGQLGLDKKIFEAALTSLTLEMEKFKNKNLVITDWETKLLKQFQELAEKQMREIDDQEKEKAYQLSLRMTGPYQPIQNTQNVEFPAKESLSFQNKLVAVLDEKSSIQYNFVLADGTTSQTQSSSILHEVKINPADSEVKKIVLWYDPGQKGLLEGIQLFDKNNVTLLQTGYNFNSYKSQETILEDGEKILGFKASLHSAGFAYYDDFQFILGKII